MVIIIILIIGIFFVINEESSKLSSVPEGQLPEPGLTPRNPFYLTDRLTEDFLLFVYLEPQRKAEVAFRLAKEKLAEVKELEGLQEPASVVIEEVNKKAIQESRQLYEKYLAIAQENLTKANQDQKLPELSFEYLDKILSKELPPAKPLLEKVYSALPKAVQNKLDAFGSWFLEQKNKAELYFQVQKEKFKIFLKDYLKQKASNFIEDLFNSK